MIKVLFYNKGALVVKDRRHACFSVLRNKIDCDLVKFYPRIPKGFLFTDFWLQCLTEWGFKFKQVKSYFEVEGENHYIKTINLIFLRYLDSSDNLNPVVSLLHDLSIKHPEIDKWKLFHAAHYLIYNKLYFNTNHTLLDHAPRKIISLDEFWANVEKLSKQDFYYGMFSDAMGNSRINHKDVQKAIKDNDALTLIKLLC